MLTPSLKVTTHGRRQLELQLHYPIPREEKRCRVALDAYIFCPEPLKINQERYGVARFLRDLTTYTRYDVPPMRLRGLLDPTNELSPLSRLRTPAQAAEALSPDRTLHELKTLVNIFHAEIKAERKRLCALTATAENLFRLEEETARYAEQVRQTLNVFRSEILNGAPAGGEQIRQATRWADEALSLAAEKQFFALWEQYQAKPDFQACAHILAPHVSDESRYRAEQGYPSLVNPLSEEENERFLHRQGLLKKWAESSLYMAVARTPIAERIGQILMGVAAGLAMLFAAVSLVLTENYFPRNSAPWILLVVLAYMLKDRLKEGLRLWLIGRLPQVMADRIDNLYSPLPRAKVGQTRANINFLKPSGAPDDILRLRRETDAEFLGSLPPEDVLVFQKTISLRPQALLRQHRRIEAVADILRLGLHDWMMEMDDPAQEVCMPLPNGTLAKLRTRRAYRLHVITRLVADQSAPLYSHHVLVMHREGVIRLETIREGITLDGLR